MASSGLGPQRSQGLSAFVLLGRVLLSPAAALASAAALVPTQVGCHPVPFLNYLGSKVFAGEDSILTEEAPGSHCPGSNPALLLTSCVTLHGSCHPSGKWG